MPPPGKIIVTESLVCERVGALRRFARRSQENLALAVGLTRDQLANIETGRTLLGFWTGWQICRVLDVNQSYLATGVGPQKPFEDVDPRDLDVPIVESATFLELYLGAVGRDIVLRNELRANKTALTDTFLLETIPRVKLPRDLAELREWIRVKTAARGAKAALAKELEVRLSDVSRWLSGKRIPDGETTLKLLRWVGQERK